MQGWLIGLGKRFHLGFTATGSKFTVTVCSPSGTMAHRHPHTLSCVGLLSSDSNHRLCFSFKVSLSLMDT